MNEKTLKTSYLLHQSSSYETSDINQSINQYQMIGSIYERGVIDEMLATNPVIQLGVMGLTAAMSSAQISLSACGCKPEVYEFIDEMLFRSLDTRFQQVFLRALDALIYGVSAAELSIEYKYGRWVLKDISARPVSGFDLYNIKKDPKNFWIEGTYRWFDQKGALKSQDCGAPWETGKSLMAWFVYPSGSLLGRSILRPIVNEHKEKTLIRQLRGNAIPKSLYGTPVLHARKRDENEEPLREETVDQTAQALAVAATGRASCLYIPADFDAPDVLYAQDSGLQRSIEAENSLDIQILMALGSSAYARGVLTGFGSQGAAELDSDLQNSVRNLFFQWFSSEMQPLIDYFVDLNFGEQDRYPELVISSPSQMTTPQLSRTLVQLVSAGLYKPTTDDESKLRELLRMPQRTDESKLLQTPNENVNNNAGLGITGHYSSVIDTREGRDILYEETKVEQ